MLPSPTPHDESSPSPAQASTAAHEMLISFFQQQQQQTGATLPMVPTVGESPTHPFYPHLLHPPSAEEMAKDAVSASFLNFLQQMGCPPPSSSLPQAPTYVNAKQYHRILQRRKTRSFLNDYYQRQQRKKRERPYQHESRHLHAMKRPRDKHGRFLTGAALEDYYQAHPAERPPPRPPTADVSERATGTKEEATTEEMLPPNTPGEMNDPVNPEWKLA